MVGLDKKSGGIGEAQQHGHDTQLSIQYLLTVFIDIFTFQTRIGTQLRHRVSTRLMLGYHRYNLSDKRHFVVRYQSAYIIFRTK